MIIQPKNSSKLVAHSKDNSSRSIASFSNPLLSTSRKNDIAMVPLSGTEKLKEAGKAIFKGTGGVLLGVLSCCCLVGFAGPKCAKMLKADDKRKASDQELTASGGRISGTIKFSEGFRKFLKIIATPTLLLQAASEHAHLAKSGTKEMEENDADLESEVSPASPSLDDE